MPVSLTAFNISVLVTYTIHWDDRYMHFQVAASSTRRSLPSRNEVSALPHVVRDRLLPKPPGAVEQDKGLAQWVNCDIRSFDYSVLGQYVPQEIGRYGSCTESRLDSRSSWRIHHGKVSSMLHHPACSADNRYRISTCRSVISRTILI